MIVMKFGGTSLGNAQRIRTAVELIAQRRERRPLVVLSAFSGVTNALLAAAKSAHAGHVEIEPLLDRHREVCRDLQIDENFAAPLLSELHDLLKGISLVRELTPRSLDYAASFGERCSVEIVAEFMRHHHGLNARAFPAWELGLVTDDQFMAAVPLPDAEAQMRAAIDALPSDLIPLVTGFLGKNRAGEITTLGRNGSDYSATLFGAAAHVEEVEIWTDVDGVMTADPRVIAEAQPVEVLTYDEAAELAYYGGKVLHPSTLTPTTKRDIPVRVLNTLNPKAPGTRIVRQRNADEQKLAGPVQSIVFKKDTILINLVSARMLMMHGFLARVFEILARHQVVINMVATSEVSVSMTTDSMKGLNDAIKEISALGEVTVETGKCIVGVVGQGIKTVTGFAAEVFNTVREAGVTVELISLGASKVNVTFLIDNADVERCIRALHDRLFGPNGISGRG